MLWERIMSQSCNMILEITHRRQTKKFILNEVFNSVVNYDDEDPYETSVSGYAKDEAKLNASVTACIDPDKRFWRGRDRPLCYIDFILITKITGQLISLRKRYLKTMIICAKL